MATDKKESKSLLKWGLVGKLFMGPKEASEAGSPPTAEDVGKIAGKGLHGASDALKQANKKAKRK